jgi:hypothetical protein
MLAGLLFGAGLLACGSDEPSEPEPAWQLVQDELPAALLSVWGTGSNDVWSVGADTGDGTGPLVLHLEGGSWSRLATGASGDLWWVFGFEGGPIFMGGAGGMILRYEAGAFTRMDTPGSGVVFGLWGSAPDEMWAVGGEAGGSRGAFAWRLESGSWASVPGFPTELAETDALWKIYGRGANDVWMVGTGGKMLHWDGSALSPGFAGLAESLFTVHGNSQRFAAVGGFGTGLLLEQAVGAAASEPWVNRSPAGAPSIIGVCLAEGDGYAVGEFGYVARRGATQWATEETGLESVFGSRSLHSVWLDPAGGAWTVGGQVRVPPLTRGVMLHRGESVPSGLP